MLVTIHGEVSDIIRFSAKVYSGFNFSVVCNTLNHSGTRFSAGKPLRHGHHGKIMNLQGVSGREQRHFSLVIFMFAPLSLCCRCCCWLVAFVIHVGKGFTPSYRADLDTLSLDFKTTSPIKRARSTQMAFQNRRAVLEIFHKKNMFRLVGGLVVLGLWCVWNRFLASSLCRRRRARAVPSRDASLIHADEGTSMHEAEGSLL